MTPLIGKLDELLAGGVDSKYLSGPSLIEDLQKIPKILRMSCHRFLLHPFVIVAASARHLAFGVQYSLCTYNFIEYHVNGRRLKSAEKLAVV